MAENDQIYNGLNESSIVPYKSVSDVLWVNENLYISTLERWDDLSGGRLDPPKIINIKNEEKNEFDLTDDVIRTEFKILLVVTHFFKFTFRIFTKISILEEISYFF